MADGISLVESVCVYVGACVRRLCVNRHFLDVTQNLGEEFSVRISDSGRWLKIPNIDKSDGRISEIPTEIS